MDRVPSVIVGVNFARSCPEKSFGGTKWSDIKLLKALTPSAVIEPSDVIVEPEIDTSSAPETGSPCASVSLTLILIVSLGSAISKRRGNGIGLPSLIEFTTFP